MRESVLKCTHSIFFFKQLPLLIYLWLHWIFIAAQAFLWLRRAGATLIAVHGILITVASFDLCEHGL